MMDKSDTTLKLCKLCFVAKRHNHTIFGSNEKELEIDTILLKYLGVAVSLLSFLNIQNHFNSLIFS